jgi:hypothetical protein
MENRIAPGIYKFVAIGREIRFFDNSDEHINHVTAEEKPLVIGAGTIAVFDEYWKLYDNHSVTLKVYCDPTIIPRLTRLLQRQHREKSDYSAILEEKSDPVVPEKKVDDYLDLLKE